MNDFITPSLCDPTRGITKHKGRRDDQESDQYRTVRYRDTKLTLHLNPMNGKQFHSLVVETFPF